VYSCELCACVRVYHVCVCVCVCACACLHTCHEQGAKLNPGWVRNVDKQSLLWLRYRKSTEGET
jgi:hypothetical protein